MKYAILKIAWKFFGTLQLANQGLLRLEVTESLPFDALFMIASSSLFDRLQLHKSCIKKYLPTVS